MRRDRLAPLLASLLAAVFILAAVARPALAAATVGQPAPAVELPGLAGPISLASLKGKVVLVDFWASWCGPCAQSFPWLSGLHKELSSKGFTVLAVNVDKERAKADAFLRKHPVPFPVALDPKGAAAAVWGLPGMPSTYLVDRQGVVRRAHTGFRPEEADKLAQEIRQLVDEKPSAEAK